MKKELICVMIILYFLGDCYCAPNFEYKNCHSEINGEKIALIESGAQNNSCETNNMNLTVLSVEKMSETFNCMFDSRLKQEKIFITDGIIKVASDKNECKKCETCEKEKSCSTFYYEDYQTFMTHCCEEVEFNFFLCKSSLNLDTDTKKKSSRIKTAGLILLCLFFVFVIIITSICFYRKYKTADNSNSNEDDEVESVDNGRTVDGEIKLVPMTLRRWIELNTSHINPYYIGLRIIDEVARVHKLGCVNLRLIPEKIWMIPEDGHFNVKLQKSFGVPDYTVNENSSDSDEFDEFHIMLKERIKSRQLKKLKEKIEKELEEIKEANDGVQKYYIENMLSEEITISQSSDVYQLSILLFKMLFSFTRNLITIEQDEYETAIENFLNEDSENRIPNNFFSRSKAKEDKTKKLLISGVSSRERPTIKQFKEEYADCEPEVTRIAMRNMFSGIH